MSLICRCRRCEAVCGYLRCIICRRMSLAECRPWRAPATAANSNSASERGLSGCQSLTSRLEVAPTLQQRRQRRLDRPAALCRPWPIGRQWQRVIGPSPGPGRPTSPDSARAGAARC